MSLPLYRELVPEHAAVVDATVLIWLREAALLLDPAAFGNPLPTATVWLAAHLYATSPGGGASGGPGPLMSRRARELSETWAVGSVSSGLSSDSSLQSTAYGRNFLFIRDSRAVGYPGFISLA